jgi:peptidoglycan/LPS O-acetylase OafA/YrhL
MKSVLAVLAGLAVTVALSMGADFVLDSSGVFPSKGADKPAMYWAIATGYRIVIAIFGCWVAARLAPSKPMNHALIAGGIGACIATAGAIFAWNQGPEFGPHWYAVGLAVTALPCAWIGGKLMGSDPPGLSKMAGNGV